MLAKSCVLCCVSHNGNGDDHGIRQADTARAHARWWNLVASHEATNTLYREMCLMPYLPGGMVVAITVESATLFYIVYNRITSFYFITQLF
jgi:hypothetical protein